MWNLGGKKDDRKVVGALSGKKKRIGGRYGWYIRVVGVNMIKVHYPHI
jgi:hypothetical protein